MVAISTAFQVTHPFGDRREACLSPTRAHSQPLVPGPRLEIPSVSAASGPAGDREEGEGARVLGDWRAAQLGGNSSLLSSGGTPTTLFSCSPSPRS